MKIVSNSTNLKSFNTYGVSVISKFFSVAKKEVDFVQAVTYCISNKVKSIVLGGGSNVLFLNDIKKDLVIKNEYQVIDNIGFGILRVSSGTALSSIVSYSFEHLLSGLEWSAGIPGTLGGAIVSNAGSFGGEMKDIIQSVKVIEISFNSKGEYDNFVIKRMKNSECEFEYRSSIFKKNPNKYIILDADLKLDFILKENLSAKKDIYIKNIKKKKETQPISERSAGCVFKNINMDIYKSIFRRKFVRFLKDIGYEWDLDEDNRVPLGLIFDKLGLKGKKIDTISISEKHANFLISNSDNVKIEDLYSMIYLLKSKVYNMFRIKIDTEIVLIGDEKKAKKKVKGFL
ncbi:UDP-N-acetylmuramate dehydrogenase [Patescibacteria group bacterium]|nr:UDP-N-acetylmuramate dehydrogenase [Patescibacteria group bacterium]